MAELFLTAHPAMVNYRMQIEDPVPPFALNMLAASGLFDVIEVAGTQSGSGDVRLEGRSLLKAALVVWDPVNREIGKAQKVD